MRFCSLEKKMCKGLTELEINAAFERFNATSSMIGNPGMASFVQYADGQPIYAAPRTTWRDYANVAVIFGGFSYAAYHFCKVSKLFFSCLFFTINSLWFKRYIFPRWLGIPDPDEERFGRLTEMISQTNNSVQFLSDSIQQTLTAVRLQQDSVQTLMQNMQQVRWASYTLKNPENFCRKNFFSRNFFEFLIN